MPELPQDNSAGDQDLPLEGCDELPDIPGPGLITSSPHMSRCSADDGTVRHLELFFSHNYFYLELLGMGQFARYFNDNIAYRGREV